MNGNKEILLSQGGGSTYWVMGDLYTFKLTGKETNGAFTLIEEIIQPQGGPPLHVHYREDETFYILKGDLQFRCGEKEDIFGPGSLLYVPKGTAHSFRNIGEGKVQMLCMISPAGLENFFYEIGTPTADSTTSAPHSLALLDKIKQLASKYHFDLLDS